MGNTESIEGGRPFQPNNDRVRLHRLCNVCKTVLASSPLLRGEKEREDFLSGSAFSYLLPPLDTASLPLFEITHSEEFGHGDRDGPFYLEGEYVHHVSAAALELSAKNGCHLCSLFWYGLSAESTHHIGLYVHRDFQIFKEELDQSAQHRLHFEAAGPPDESLFVRVGHRRSSHSTQCGVVVLYAGKAGNAPLPKLRSVFKVLKSAKMFEVLTGRLTVPNVVRDSVSTTSDAMFGMAEGWLNDCMANHEDCSQRLDGDSTMPSRLIDVGPPDGTSIPRLVICKDLDRKPSYVALSHCWGGASPLMLTSSTSESLLAGNPLSSFPLTFRDAIQICRRLNQRFLWIDSLCIFQDSPTDWATESAHMGAIYQNCTFSIAALSGRSSSHGCLATRNPLSYRPLPLPCKPDYYFIQTMRPYPWTPDSFTTAPLLRRGWVLQERCLAPRTLYFGDHGVYWECRAGRLDENHLSAKSKQSFEKESGDLAAKTTLAQVRLGELGATTADVKNDTDVKPFVTAWYELLSHYATCRFTFGRDKLIAIAGITATIQRRTGLTSFAGLWRELLLTELLWSINLKEPSARAVEYVAPSFSWASVDGFVVGLHERRDFHPTQTTSGKPHPQQKALAQVFEASADMKDPTKTVGAVVGGFVRLRAPVKHLTLHNSGAKPPAHVPNPNTNTPQAEQAIWMHPSPPLEQRESAYRAGKFCRAPNRWLRLDTLEYDSLEELDVVLVMLVEWTGELKMQWLGEEYSEFDTWRHVAGVVLVEERHEMDSQEGSEGELEDGEEGWKGGSRERETYKRIGMFEDCYNERLTRWWEAWDYEILVIR